MPNIHQLWNCTQPSSSELDALDVVIHSMNYKIKNFLTTPTHPQVEGNRHGFHGLQFWDHERFFTVLDKF